MRVLVRVMIRLCNIVIIAAISTVYVGFFSREPNYNIFFQIGGFFLAVFNFMILLAKIEF